jgi:gliding motility-associated-like protein
MYQNLFKPKVVISNGGVNALTCKTGSVTLTNQSSTGIPSATGNPTSNPVVGFLWEGPTPQEPLNNSSTYVGLTPGVYTLTVKDLNNGCVNFTTTLIDDGRDFPRVTLTGPVTRDCGSVSASITPEYLDALSDMTYRWFAGEGNPGSVNSATLPTYNPTDVGDYFVEVTSKKSSCSVTASVAVVNGTISTKFEADKTSGFAPLKVNFDNQSRTTLDPVDTKVNNAIKSIWNFGNGTSQSFSTTVDATVTYSLPGNYIVTLFANKGSCVQSFQKTITVELPSKAIIPNIFTPNNDKVNDVFRLEATNLIQVSMVVIDRWGHVVYDVNSTTGNVEWDGKNQRGAECAEGIYFYTIKATGSDGIKYDNKGTITLAR